MEGHIFFKYELNFSETSEINVAFVNVKRIIWFSFYKALCGHDLYYNNILIVIHIEMKF